MVKALDYDFSRHQEIPGSTPGVVAFLLLLVFYYIPGLFFLFLPGRVACFQLHVICLALTNLGTYNYNEANQTTTRLEVWVGVINHANQTTCRVVFTRRKASQLAQSRATNCPS